MAVSASGSGLRDHDQKWPELWRNIHVAHRTHVPWSERLTYEQRGSLVRCSVFVRPVRACAQHRALRSGSAAARRCVRVRRRPGRWRRRAARRRAASRGRTSSSHPVVVAERFIQQDLARVFRYGSCVGHTVCVFPSKDAYRNTPQKRRSSPVWVYSRYPL